MKRKYWCVTLSAIASLTLACGLAACSSDEKNQDKNSKVEAVDPGYWTDEDLEDSELYANPGIESDYGLKFRLSSSGDYYTVTGMKEEYEYVSVPSMYYGLPVTEIDAVAFEESAILKKVVIPESVTSIGGSCFYHCTALSSVSLSEGLESIGSYAFAYCPSLTRIALPEGLTTIGESAFYACSSLERVLLPQSLETVCGDAFTRCAELSEVYISDLSAWCSIDFENGTANPLSLAGTLYVDCVSVTDTLVIPDDVTSVGKYAFYGFAPLSSVTVPDGVTSIGKRVFSNCISLTNISIGKGLTSVGDYAFSGCESLSSVYITDLAAWCSIDFEYWTANPLYYGCNLYLNGEPFELEGDFVIPEGVTHVGSYVFSDCSSITSVYVPKSVTSIGHGAFCRCTSLTGVYITDLVAWMLTDFGNSTSNPLCYAGNLYLNGELVTDLVTPQGMATIGKYVFCGCTSLTSVIIPDSVTVIDYFAFSNCSSLTSIVIPSSVTKIGDYAFSDCTSLKSITVPDSVITIGEEAFENCTSLTSIIIPDSVKEIGRMAFSGCTSLTSIIIPDSVTSIGYQAFNGCTSLVYVYYFGSPSGWSEIYIEDSRLLMGEGGVKIFYYSETEPDDDGYYWHYDDNGEPVIW